MSEGKPTAGPWCPDRCPVTMRPFFTWIEHPELGVVPTYGGPYDSYTIPEPDNLPAKGERIAWEDIEFSSARYDHDEGCWSDYVDPGMRIVTDDRLLELEASAPTLKAMNAELVEALEGVIRMTRPANSEDHDKVVAAYRALKNAKGE